MKYLRKKNWKLINHPPYSPDLNPIEKVWCSMKQTIRTDSNNFKTISALSRVVKAEQYRLMSDDDYRKKVCYRYRECNMILL